jgi:signal transduction histidine kinase
LPFAPRHQRIATDFPRRRRLSCLLERSFKELFAVNALHEPVGLEQIGDRLDDVLHSTTEPATRSTRLAELLHTLWPHASLHACLLTEGGRSFLTVLDEARNGSADWQEHLSPQGKTAEELAALWSSLLEVADQTVLVQPVTRNGTWHGLAALRLPQTAGHREERQTSAGLAAFVQMLALLLTLENCRRQSREQERLANVGELAGVVSHEFTNFLNVLLLQVSMLELQLPASQRADLVELRRQGTVAADLVRQFMEYRHGLAQLVRPVELNEALGAVAKEQEFTPGAELQLSLAPAPLYVTGARPALDRLLSFLLSNAARAAALGEGQVRVSTQRADGRILLQIEDDGPNVAAEGLPYYFDPLHPPREGVDVLELAACRALVRRQGGNIRAERRPGGGVRVIVEWPAGNGVDGTQ